MSRPRSFASASSRALTSFSAFILLSVWYSFSSLPTQNELLSRSSYRPICILVSLALLLLACQQPHLRVPWPRHCPFCRPALLPSPSLPSVSVSTGVSAFISLRVLVTRWAYTCRNVKACVLTTALASTLFSVSRSGKALTPARVSASDLTGASTSTRVSASAIVFASTTNSL